MFRQTFFGGPYHGGRLLDFQFHLYLYRTPYGIAVDRF